MSVIDGNMQPLIAVDFDLTLCQSEYPKCGPPIPGGKEALQRFRDLGYLILVYSCRTCSWHCETFGVDKTKPVMDREHVKAMKDWLDELEYAYDEIDDGSRGKPFGTIICDKAIQFKDNWAEIAALIESKTVKEKDCE